MLDLLLADSEAFWLNLANISLGILVAGCSLAVFLGVVQDVMGTVRRRYRILC